LNKLYYGDNLAILRDHIADESVDLVYLDPPFNSNATYNVLFRAPSGEQSRAQIAAFEDAWRWNEQAEEAYWQVLKGPSPNAARMLEAVRGFLGENDMMAYLAMMAVRLIELHRVLKPTGSLYLHCDPTASHYLKMLLDAIFGAENFRNEIVWKRTTTHSDSKTWSRVADSIFFYTKGSYFTWNIPREAHSEQYIESKYKYDGGDGRGTYRLDNMTSPNPRPNMMYEWKGFSCPEKGWRYSKETMQQLDSEGRIWYPRREDDSFDASRRPQLKRYLAEMDGGVKGTIWTDIFPVNSQARERLGYPTQKPVALLERIVSASSNEGDVVLDPFCGCGTTVHAAQKLNRQWIGIDITHLAIALVGRRLRESFGTALTFETIGVPKDIDGARALADKNKFEFERWAVTLIPDAQPYKSKGGGDSGVDGVLYFKFGKKESGKAILSVKGGKGIKPTEIRDLKGTVEREKAALGLYITLHEPSKQMIAEAASAGFVELATGLGVKTIPKIQILTIEKLMNGELPRLPLIDPSVYKRAAKEDASEKDQSGFEL